MNSLFADFKAKISEFVKENKGVALFLSTLYAVALFPLLRANFNYRDDGGRVLWAFDGWSSFGRITSNALSHVIHADKYLRDISPLTQIIALLLLVAASMILLKVVRSERKLTVWDAVAVLPLGLFPYFLCCFSYKYDSPYMALSVLVSILPLAVRGNRKVYYPLAFICTLLMCTTYQASAGLFPMLVVYTAFNDWKNGAKARDTICYCLYSAIAFIAAMLVFFFLIPKGGSGYVAEKMSFNAFSIKHVIENYLTYIKTFKSDFRIKWFAVIAIISALFLVRNAIETKRNRFLTLLVSAAVYAFIFILSFGAFPFLDEPFLMPRGMYGICMFIALICLGATSSDNAGGQTKALRAISWLAVLALSWMCVVFSCTYGNALAAQKSYDEFRVAEIASELADLYLVDEEKPATIQIVGSAGYAAGIKNIPGDSLLLRLVPPPFGGENYWSYLPLLSYYGLPEMEYSDDLANGGYADWKIAHENCYHVIYTNGASVIVELK